MNEEKAKNIDDINFGDKISQRLIKKAKKYNDHQEDLYLAELGWEDWMEDYLEVNGHSPTPWEDPLTERQTDFLDEYLAKIWKKSRKERDEKIFEIKNKQ